MEEEGTSTKIKKKTKMKVSFFQFIGLGVQSVGASMILPSHLGTRTLP